MRNMNCWHFVNSTDLMPTIKTTFNVELLDLTSITLFYRQQTVIKKGKVSILIKLRIETGSCLR